MNIFIMSVIYFFKNIWPHCEKKLLGVDFCQSSLHFRFGNWNVKQVSELDKTRLKSLSGCATIDKLKPSLSSQWSLIRSFVWDFFCISFVWLSSKREVSQTKSCMKLHTRLHWLERLGLSLFFKVKVLTTYFSKSCRKTGHNVLNSTNTVSFQEWGNF